MSLAPKPSKRIKRVMGYGIALVLPWLAVMGTERFEALHGTPLALSFVAGAIIGTLFDLGPSILAVVVTAVVYNYELVEPFGHLSLAPQALFHTLLIFAVGLLLVVFGERRRRATRQLEVIVESLREQTDALCQAQQASNSAAWTYNAQTGQTLWHPGGKEIFGRSLQEISDNGSPKALVLEEDRVQVDASAQRTLLTGAPFHVAFRVRWPSGEIHWL